MTKPLNVKDKIKVVKNQNPFAEGSDTAKRVNAVLTSTSVEQAIKKGARTSTVRWALKNRLIKLVHVKDAA